MFAYHYYATGQAKGPCLANLHRWSLAKSTVCKCSQQHTMNYIANACPLTNFEGGLQLLHSAVHDAHNRLEMTATRAVLAK